MVCDNEEDTSNHRQFVCLFVCLFVHHHGQGIFGEPKRCVSRSQTPGRATTATPPPDRPSRITLGARGRGPWGVGISDNTTDSPARRGQKKGRFVSLKLGVAQGEPFEVQVMPTFHPAYLLRSYTVETRAQVWEDLKKVLSALGRSLPARK